MDLMERAVADYEAELECADYEGYQRGVEEGRQSGVIELARKMLAKKIPFEDIQEISGLDLVEIKNLQMQMNN